MGGLGWRKPVAPDFGRWIKVSKREGPRPPGMDSLQSFGRRNGLFGFLAMALVLASHFRRSMADPSLLDQPPSTQFT